MVTGTAEPVVPLKVFRRVPAGTFAVERSMDREFPPASVRDWGARMRGVSAVP
jgi:hypothetical protein